MRNTASKSNPIEVTSTIHGHNFLLSRFIASLNIGKNRDLPVLQTCCFFAVQVHSDNSPKIRMALYRHHTRRVNHELTKFASVVEWTSSRAVLHLVHCLLELLSRGAEQ